MCKQPQVHTVTVHVQCCLHLLTGNPKIYEENPGECIDLMGIDTDS